MILFLLELNFIMAILALQREKVKQIIHSLFHINFTEIIFCVN